MEREGIPFLETLSEADQAKYLQLYTLLHIPACKNRRHKGMTMFGTCIEWVKEFVMRHDNDDANRGRVSGIFWFKDAIAINIHQLSLLTGRCKSSLNGSFSLLNYGTVPNGCEAAKSLTTIFPELAHNFQQLRQWTVRKKMTLTPTPRPMALVVDSCAPHHLTPPVPMLPSVFSPPDYAPFTEGGDLPDVDFGCGDPSLFGGMGEVSSFDGGEVGCDIPLDAFTAAPESEWFKSC
jgi:hypothetical protein